VSADFRRHSVAYFVEHVLAAHDRSRFDVWCYATQEKYDAVSERIRSSVDGWVDAGSLSDEELSARIAEDGIDLLVDLSGHTAGNRLPVFARRPARVQATWLGYPTTTGLRAIDFRVSDWAVDPQGYDRFSSERVLRMPASYFCYGAPRESPDPGLPPALATGMVTFGSFNNLAKLSGATMRLWARVLEAVPGSRLLVKSKALVDEHTRDDLRERFERLGVSAERLEFRGWMEETSAHLAVYNEVDIALDSFPYNGATTTCEALWMGVPVLTLAGESHAARAGSSILRAAGREEWVASRTGEFIDKAATLAGDPVLLSRHRAGLRAQLRASELMNVEQFDRALEEHYLQMLARDSVRAP
jgi:predicted O-linked N-acetylglucosamine transferase (SPINDLY family)